MPLTVDRFVLDEQFASNCWVVRAGEQGPAAVVDPGGDPAPLLEAGVEVAGILVTHSDVDHIGGVAALAAATGAEVWIPAGEADVLRRGTTRGGFPVGAYDPEHEVRDGDAVTVAGITFDVVGIPGHSIDHVAFAADGSLFSGDLLFRGSVGRADFEGGDWGALLESVRRLVERFGDVTVYPGHGGPTTLRHELETNPFLHELRAPAR